MQVPASRHDAGSAAFYVALPPPFPIGLVLFEFRSVRKPIGTEIFAAYSLIDENYFRYTRAPERVKRKIFSQINSELWKK
jgi:hypothetical protein